MDNSRNDHGWSEGINDPMTMMRQILENMNKTQTRLEKIERRFVGQQDTRYEDYDT